MAVIGPDRGNTSSGRGRSLPLRRIVIELTNRCNLRCRHCFRERHAATDDLPLEILEKVVREGRSCGLEQVSFTGGEPTLHPGFPRRGTSEGFPDVVRLVAAAGYDFGFVSNGLIFPKIHPLLVEHRDHFEGVTFSVDGAREATHDRLRGQGSYRRVMQAATICTFKDLPFTFNMVLTAHNRGEVGEMIELAARLGCGGLRFGHLIPSSETARRHLDLTPHERRAVEAEVRRLGKTAAVPVGMASGFFNDEPFFACGPLALEELSLDYRGNVTLCCHLSGLDGPNCGADVVGNLHQLSLADACDRFRGRVASYLADKRRRVERGELGELDHFPCWYCAKYLDKVSGLAAFPRHPWARDLANTASRSAGHGSGSED
ncbi:MAG: radical SAM protein [bacterium]|nr:radical SAM protein [bacterium]